MNELDKMLKNLQKKYGEGSILSMKDGAESNFVERIPVDSPKIADVLGGGIPRGRILELYGPESSGKTSLACYFSAQVQKFDVPEKKRKGRVAFIDAEHALDLEYARTFGFDTSLSIISQPDSGEQALDIAIDLVESGEIDFIVVDSVAALTPRAELEGEMGDMQMGAQARMMGKALRKLTASMSYSKCTILFLNQIRQKIGVMYGNPDTTPGGNALKFGASIRLEIRKIEFIGEKKEITGLRSRLRAVKNKTTAPGKKQDIDFIFGEGVNSFMEWVDFAIHHGVIEKGGAWFNLPGVPDKFQGKDRVVDYLRKNEDLYRDITEQTKARMGKRVLVTQEEEENEEVGQDRTSSEDYED